MLELNIKIFDGECAAILGVLGNLPYRQVAPLIDKITTQAEEQKRLADERHAAAARGVAAAGEAPE